MTLRASPGRLIGSGRAADVYELDGGRVLRRYRRAFDAGPEARLMTYLHSAGFPVPQVFDADGTDMVMERIDGPDMLADSAARPWRTARNGATLAEMHDRLHAIPAPPELRQLPGGGDRIVHLDLHPGNVMLTEAGPLVIDWSNASAGHPGQDVAIALLIMRTSDLDVVPLFIRPVAGFLRNVLVRRFEAVTAADPGPFMADMARVRLRDPNVRPGEAVRLERVIRASEAS
jgi:aminoglycoside phosphotransferase (APT) family kinase protein